MPCGTCTCDLDENLVVENTTSVQPKKYYYLMMSCSSDMFTQIQEGEIKLK